MESRRLHIAIPEELAKEIDKTVGKRGRSQFLVEVAKRELRRLQMLKTLGEASGAWQDNNHPELKAGAAAWVHKLRKSKEIRFK
jgi:metal-responsive CopG/Arc/MetJ family transcriptional regulator